jgi:hypothetical protein
MTRGNALPSGPSDFNLYSGLIALGVGLFGCLLARYSQRGHGPRPRGDALSWLVHTRLGPGPKSWLGRQLDLGVLLSATYGELLIVSAYVGWLIIRFAFFMQRYSEAETTAVRVGRSFGRLGAPMILMTYLLAQRCVRGVPAPGAPTLLRFAPCRVASVLAVPVTEGVVFARSGSLSGAGCREYRTSA